jgi:hypothetical protein
MFMALQYKLPNQHELVGMIVDDLRTGAFRNFERQLWQACADEARVPTGRLPRAGGFDLIVGFAGRALASQFSIACLAPAVVGLGYGTFAVCAPKFAGEFVSGGRRRRLLTAGVDPERTSSSTS